MAVADNREEADGEEVEHGMCGILDDIKNPAVIERVKAQAAALCARFPVYR